MATYTPNYNLSKPESTDDMTDFFADYGDNMDIIDENMGGGGSGGHTIIDENDVSMTQRAGLQFTGNVTVTDDAVNDKTIVDIQGGGGDVADVEVNGISVVDAGTKIAEITSYEEVTIAEYESIPVADRESNGIAYFIKDLNNSHVQGYPPLIFSFEEREVGVWVDGKPLYQRTVFFNLNSGSGWTNYAHGIANIDSKVAIGGFIRPSGGGTTYGVGTNAVGGLSIAFDQTNISFYTNNSYFQNYRVTAILHYTKTTDTAGSGTWNGQGGIAHHYSTNETVIGTWLGKTLYQRVFDLGSDIVISSSSFTSTSIDASNMQTLVNAFGIYSTGETRYNLMPNRYNNVIRLQTDRNNASANVRYVVLEYTKT